jgi:hypothetical protein
VIGHGVEVGILESLGYKAAGLGVVPVGRDLRAVDVLVILAGKIEREGDVRGEIELRVERAGAVAGLHACRSRELVDIRRAGGGAVEALLNAVALVLDHREGEINFSDNACDVEALGI